MNIKQKSNQFRLEIEDILSRIDVMQFIQGQEKSVNDYFNSKAVEIRTDILRLPNELGMVQRRIKEYYQIAEACFDDNNIFAAQLILSALESNDIYRLHVKNDICVLGKKVPKIRKKLSVIKNKFSNEALWQIIKNKEGSIPSPTFIASNFEFYCVGNHFISIKDVFKGKGRPEEKLFVFQINVLSFLNDVKINELSLEDVTKCINSLYDEMLTNESQVLNNERDKILNLLDKNNPDVKSKIDNIKQLLEKEVQQDKLILRGLKKLIVNSLNVQKNAVIGVNKPVSKANVSNFINHDFIKYGDLNAFVNVPLFSRSQQIKSSKAELIDDRANASRSLVTDKIISKSLKKHLHNILTNHELRQSILTNKLKKHGIKNVNLYEYSQKFSKDWLKFENNSLGKDLIKINLGENSKEIEQQQQQFLTNIFCDQVIEMVQYEIDCPLEQVVKGLNHLILEKEEPARTFLYREEGSVISFNENLFGNFNIKSSKPQYTQDLLIKTLKAQDMQDKYQNEVIENLMTHLLATSNVKTIDLINKICTDEIRAIGDLNLTIDQQKQLGVNKLYEKVKQFKITNKQKLNLIEKFYKSSLIKLYENLNTNLKGILSGNDILSPLSKERQKQLMKNSLEAFVNNKDLPVEDLNLLETYLTFKGSSKEFKQWLNKNSILSINSEVMTIIINHQLLDFIENNASDELKSWLLDNAKENFNNPYNAIKINDNKIISDISISFKDIVKELSESGFSPKIQSKIFELPREQLAKALGEPQGAQLLVLDRFILQIKSISKNSNFKDGLQFLERVINSKTYDDLKLSPEELAKLGGGEYELGNYNKFSKEHISDKIKQLAIKQYLSIIINNSCLHQSPDKLVPLLLKLRNNIQLKNKFELEDAEIELLSLPKDIYNVIKKNITLFKDLPPTFSGYLSSEQDPFLAAVSSLKSNYLKELIFNNQFDINLETLYKEADKLNKLCFDIPSIKKFKDGIKEVLGIDVSDDDSIMVKQETLRQLIPNEKLRLLIPLDAKLKINSVTTRTSTAITKFFLTNHTVQEVKLFLKSLGVANLNSSDVNQAFMDGFFDGESLIKQIGSYNITIGKLNKNKIVDEKSKYLDKMINYSLNKNAKAKLLDGVDKYEKTHSEKSEKYAIKHNLVLPINGDKLYFRKQLIEYLKNNPMPTYKVGEVDLRKSSPEKNTIMMLDFLGEDGVELYKLALEEEAFSEKYRNAVYKKSASIVGGGKWAERPVVMVAGPSACGKTFSANLAIKKIGKMLKKNPQDNSDNLVVQPDGGTAREVSQMRKLMVQMATQHGYSGLSDLHSRSSIIGKVKHNVRDAAFASKEVGIIMPETFAKWSFSIDKHKKTMRQASKLDDGKARLIFTRIDGNNPQAFPDVVKFMGTKRAFKKVDFDKQIAVDLNNTKIVESKKYGASGFKWGLIGSKAAEQWYLKNIKNPTVLKIVNDLVVVCETKDKTTYKVAEVADLNRFLVSQKVLDIWDYSLNINPRYAKQFQNILSKVIIKKSLNKIANKDYSKVANDLANNVKFPAPDKFDFKLLFLNHKAIKKHPDQDVINKVLEEFKNLNLSDEMLCSLYNNYCFENATLKGYNEFLDNIDILPKPDILSSLDLLLPELENEYKFLCNEFSKVHGVSQLDTLKKVYISLKELNELISSQKQDPNKVDAKVKEMIVYLDSSIAAFEKSTGVKNNNDKKIIGKLLQLKVKLIANTDYVKEVHRRVDNSNIINKEFEYFFSEIINNEYESLAEFSERISKYMDSNHRVLDVAFLRDIIIKQPSMFFFLPENYQQVVHQSILQLRILGDTEQQLLANKAAKDIHSIAIENLRQLISPQKLTSNELEQLFKGTIATYEKKALRKNIATNLIAKLTGREKLTFNSEKALLLIDQYLAKKPNKYKSHFFQNLKREIFNNGFNYELLNQSFIESNKSLLFKNEFKVWRSASSSRSAQLIIGLYELVPGAQELTSGQISKLEVFTKEKLALPIIEAEQENKARNNGLIELVNNILQVPSKKMGLKLTRNILSNIDSQLNVLRRDRGSDIFQAEVIYQQFLLNNAKAKMLTEPNLCRFTGQGHYMVDVSLSESDYKNLYKQITGNDFMLLDSTAKKAVESYIGLSISTTTLCDIDVKGDPKLENIFKTWLTQGDNTANLKLAVDTLLNSSSRSSIISLQEEMESHLKLLARVCLNKLSDKGIDLDIKKIISDTLINLNFDVRQQFQEFLLKSYKGDEKTINYQSLNKNLDLARTNLSKLVKARFLQVIKKNHPLKYSNVVDILTTKLKNESFSHFTATGYDYFRVDQRNETAVRISATENTAHDKGVGATKQARRILRRNHYLNTDHKGVISCLREQNIEARVPSLAVLKIKDKNNKTLKGAERDKAAIADVADKLADSYQTMSNIAGEQQGPIIYNLLTSLASNNLFDMATNRQLESAALIIKGAHKFNKSQMDNNNFKSFFYIQNIPVNQHGASLSISSNDKQLKEVSLMAEMSMITTLNRQCHHLPFELQREVKECHTIIERAYISFLNQVHDSDNYKQSFSGSPQGKYAIKRLKQYKQKIQNISKGSIEILAKSSLKSLAALSLLQLHANNKHQNLQFGMTIQAVSVFLEQISIAGCKSANERYQAVSGRVELLKSINNRRGELSSREQDVVDAMQNMASGGEHAIEKLQKRLDLAYNEHNLQGSAAAISFEDQGAASKVKSSKHKDHGDLSWQESDTNIAESAYVSWLYQTKAGKMQAHKADHCQDLIDANEIPRTVNSYNINHNIGNKKTKVKSNFGMVKNSLKDEDQEKTWQDVVRILGGEAVIDGHINMALAIESFNNGTAKKRLEKMSKTSCFLVSPQVSLKYKNSLSGLLRILQQEQINLESEIIKLNDVKQQDAVMSNVNITLVVQGQIDEMQLEASNCNDMIKQTKQLISDFDLKSQQVKKALFSLNDITTTYIEEQSLFQSSTEIVNNYGELTGSVLKTLAPIPLGKVALHELSHFNDVTKSEEKLSFIETSSHQLKTVNTNAALSEPAKMHLAFVMAQKFLMNFDGKPTANNKIYIDGKSPEFVEMIWGALTILSKPLDIEPNAIAVISPGFKPKVKGIWSREPVVKTKMEKILGKHYINQMVILSKEVQDYKYSTDNNESFEELESSISKIRLILDT